MQALTQSLWPPRDRAVRTEYLDRALKEITATVNNMGRFLGAYGARRLTAVERGGVFYGEHLEFLEKLINLEERPMEIPRRDLSLALTSGEITFGHNAMEVRTADGHRRFAAIFTVKEYKESSLKGIDQFLDIPCELIVTQCFDFVGAEQARQSYEQQARYLEISGDAEMAHWVEIDRLMKDSANLKAFGQQQTSVFLIAPSVKQLESNVRMVQKSLMRLGLVTIREDLRFEDCYWAQLPSNFPFLARQHSVDTQHLAGFANLQRAPMGNAAGSEWGPPVTLLSTVQDTPYFFNFQRPGIAGAHTLLLGAGRRDARAFPARAGRASSMSTSGTSTCTAARAASPRRWAATSSPRGRRRCGSTRCSSARATPTAISSPPGWPPCPTRSAASFREARSASSASSPPSSSPCRRRSAACRP
ncbi:MAG: hypothetical protein WDN72_00520 [Alphaproteobacteria bacterium]